MRLRGSAAVAVLLLATAACGGQADADRVTLRVMNWASDLEFELESRIVEEFARDRPGVRVQVESIATNYGEKLITAIASGTPPDVFLLDAPDIPSFVERGLLLDLGPYADRVGYRTGAVFPEVLEIFSRDERLFAFPKDFSPMAIYYNRGLFERLGVPAPPSPARGWSWDAFRSTARAVTRDSDGDGQIDIHAVNFPRQLYEWVPWVWSAGGDILDPTGSRTSGYLDSPRTVAALRFLTELATRWGVTPPVQYRRTADPAEIGRFYVGRQAMLYSGHWDLQRLRRYQEAGEMEIGIAAVPHRPGFEPTTVLYAAGWAVPSNVRHRRLAVQLAAHLASPAAQRRRSESGLAVPALRPIALEAAERDTTGIEQRFMELVTQGRMTWGAVVRDFHEVEELANQVMDRHLLRGDDLAVAARETARAIDRVIAR